MSTNISFNDYSAPEVTKELGKIMNLTVGFFFDGTLNNKRNTYIRKETEKKEKGLQYDKVAVKENPWGIDKDSYDNDYSNVARMLDFYQESQKIYIEGIGTIDGDTDTTRGYTTGTGDTGIRGKVRIGCEKLTAKIPKNSTVNLVIDLFGFSRGAAAARTFIHEITRGKYDATIFKGEGVTYYDLDYKEVNKPKLPARGYLGYLFENKSITIKTLKIRFVGLYDTVSSYGLNFEDDTTDKVDISEINLAAVNNPSVKKVVQIAAGHEWRKNFNSTSIRGTGKKGLELTLPGCHCDIGGAYESINYKQTHYVNISNEDKNIIMKYGSASKQAEPLKEKYKKELVESGWYKLNELKYLAVGGDYSIMYEGTRYIDKRYSYISLHFMCKLASENESNFDDFGINQNFEIPKKAGDKRHILDYAKECLQKYTDTVKSKIGSERYLVEYEDFLDFENEKILINRYLHWSATNKTGHSPRKDKIRVIKDV